MKQVLTSLAVAALAPLAMAQPSLLYAWPNTPPSGTSVGRVIDACAGFGSNLVVKEGGVLFAWGGNNSHGQQGHMPPPASNQCLLPGAICVAPPTQMPLLRRASVGYEHTLALAMDPTTQPTGTFGLLAWGNNGPRAAEIPDLTDPTGYWRIDPSAKVIDLQVGEHINIVLFDNGQIAAWGHEAYGVDPRPNNTGQPLYEAYHPNYEWRFRAISCCGHAVAALQYDHTPNHLMPDLDGRIICWGTFDENPTEPQWWGPNYRGNTLLRDPPNIPAWFAPYTPPYTSITGGHHSLIGVKADGTTHIWGADSFNCRTDQPRNTTLVNNPPIPMVDIIGGYTAWMLGRRDDTGEIVGWGGFGQPGAFPMGWPSGPLPDQFKMARGNCNLTQAMARCYDANCDGSQTPPVLSINDFICFGNAFAEAQNLPYEQQVVSDANCDGSIWPPVLNVNDYQCFQAACVSPCPPGHMP